MTLNLYFGRKFLSAFLQVLAAFGAILVLIGVIDQLRRNAAGVADALYLALLDLPESLFQILPLLMMLAGLAFFLALARSSELVVVRAAGRSGLHMLVAPVAVAVMIGLVAVAVLDPLVAATSKTYDQLLVERKHGGEAVMSISSAGLWMRQGTAGVQTVIRAAGGNPDGSEIHDVSFIAFSSDGTPVERIEAATARLEKGNWVLSGAKRWDLTAPNPEQTAVRQTEEILVPTNLSADRIRDSFGQPSTIAFWSLREQIRYLELAGFSARSYRVWFQMQLALPLMFSAMVLLAAGFTMRHARMAKTGQMVLLALLGGFLFFFLRNFAQVLGENGQIPVVLAAWAPPVAATLLALALLLHTEDG